MIENYVGAGLFILGLLSGGILGYAIGRYLIYAR